MDMRKYASGLMRPEDLHNGPLQDKIVNVYINDKLNAPIITLEGGQEFVAWNNMCRVLTNAYGYEDRDWIGHVIELSLGHYTNKDGETKDNIQIKPISARDEKGEIAKPVHKDMDDEIPF